MCPYLCHLLSCCLLIQSVIFSVSCFLFPVFLSESEPPLLSSWTVLPFFLFFFIHLSVCPFLTYFLSCLPLLPPTCPSFPPSLSLPDCPSSLPLVISVLPLLLLSVSCFCPSISSSPSFPYFFLSLPFLNPICSFLLRLPSLSLHFLPSVLVYFLPSFLLSSLCPTFPHILHLPSSPPTVKAALAATPLHYKSCDIETSGTILSFISFFFYFLELNELREHRQPKTIYTFLIQRMNGEFGKVLRRKCFFKSCRVKRLTSDQVFHFKMDLIC